MDRIIYEDDVIHALKKLYDKRPLDSDRYIINECKNEIIKLPSAEPEKVLVAEVKLSKEDIQDAVDEAVKKIRAERWEE